MPAFWVEVLDNQTDDVLVASYMTTDRQQQQGNYLLALDRYDGQDVTVYLYERGTTWKEVVAWTNLSPLMNLSAHA